MLHNLIRLARHDVRVHVRRRVVHIPVRQTALRPVATVATEQGKDAHRFPCHVKVIFLSCRRFYHNFFCLCRMCLPFPSSWKILIIPDTSEGKPSEPPFLLRGSISPVPPRCLRSSNRRFTRKARHDERVHARRRVVPIPVRQTALRPVATGATEQGKDAHRFPCHVKVIFLSCRRFYHNFFCLCRMCLPFPSSWKILIIPDTSEGKPSEPPFLLRGSISPVPPRCLRSSNRRFTRKARHDERVHARRRVVPIPVRQTALRPVATGATEQGNCNDRIVEP